jgi:membrane protein DedA with SNARE-associated domain
MDGLIAWLTGLPLAVLYPLMSLFAAIENVFPPIPADSIVALGSWLAARGNGSAIGAFAATWVGNVAGAAGMYVVGRRHGAGWMRQRFPRLADEKGMKRLETLYGKYGLVALVLSRFIPGVRALVPPFAGALRIKPLGAIGSMAVASAVWYGFISYIAFTAGAEWSHVMDVIKRSGIMVAVGAAVVLITVGGFWYLRRHRTGAA